MSHVLVSLTIKNKHAKEGKKKICQNEAAVLYELHEFSCFSVME